MIDLDYGLLPAEAEDHFLGLEHAQLVGTEALLTTRDNIEAVIDAKAMMCVYRLAGSGKTMSVNSALRHLAPDNTYRLELRAGPTPRDIRHGLFKALGLPGEPPTRPIEFDNHRTVVERLGADMVGQAIDDYLGEIAAAVGLRNSVLLHERCFLAVEGETEQRAFPLLFRLCEGLSLQAAGTALWSCSNNEGALHLAQYLVKHGRTVIPAVDADSRNVQKSISKPDKLTQFLGPDAHRYARFIGEPEDGTQQTEKFNELEEIFADEVWARVANQIRARPDRPWTEADFAALRSEKKYQLRCPGDAPSSQPRRSRRQARDDVRAGRGSHDPGRRARAAQEDLLRSQEASRIAAPRSAVPLDSLRRRRARIRSLRCCNVGGSQECQPAGGFQRCMCSRSSTPRHRQPLGAGIRRPKPSEDIPAPLLTLRILHPATDNTPDGDTSASSSGSDARPGRTRRWT